jgi:hypothetical protein
MGTRHFVEENDVGQYYKIVNLTKREFLHPHKFGDGLKLMEFGSSPQGTMQALAVLLATSNGQGGGDLRTEDTVIPGRWAGDQIAIVGDYDASERYGGIYGECNDELKEDDGTVRPGKYTDISYDVLFVLLDDYYTAESYAKNDWDVQRWEEDGQEALLGHPNLVAARARAKETETT